MSLKIGNSIFKNNVIPAPLAGYTDTAFRNILFEFGCELTYSEMVSSEGLIRNHKTSFEMIDLSKDKSKVALQIFGSDPSHMAEAARMCEDKGASIIDINLGCPVKKVVKGFSGSALLKDLSLASKIISAVVKAVRIPVTVKSRSGWDQKSQDPIALSKMIEDSGANAIIIHPRTREQFFNGICDWTIIKTTKENVSIPVIGNGDVKSVQDISRMFNETKCDGVMIGREIIGNPWLFKEYFHKLEGKDFPQPTLTEKFNVFKNHLTMLIEYEGERSALLMIRKHIPKYFRGERNVKIIREHFAKIKSLKDIEEMKKLLRAENFLNNF